MNITYEELLTYDIHEAIKLIGKDSREFKTAQEWLHANDNDPARVPNNPLLQDYNWVYDHCEELLCRNIIDYQQKQPVDAYYILFKALTNKYPIDNDYNEIVLKNKPSYKFKWAHFATHLIEFMTYSFDNRLKELLSKPDVIEYFLKYPAIYDIDTLSVFSHEGQEILLKIPRIASHYTSNYKELINLIRNQPKITIPTEVILDNQVIKDLSRTHHIEEFYYYLHFISEQVSDQPFLDEHASFCDEQIANIKNGILPCYKEQYKKSSKEISIRDIRGFNYMEQQVLKRIFNRSNLEILPKKYIYQELSKYMIIGMFMSRNYQTDPYNLLIDIETLHDFSITEKRQLQGQDIYQFLLTFENKPIKEIIEFYNQGKTLPLMEILYDDWNKEHENFITELNSSIYTPDSKNAIIKDNITYYDISDIEEPIIVHNTSVSIDDNKKIKETIDTIKRGHKYCLSLSVQNQEYNKFYEEEHTKRKRTLKLAYGLLDPTKVGTVCHTDAYSQGTTDVEIENTEFKRRLYTVKSFMDRTTNYNEIVYSICGELFLPIGIICEDEITKEEQDIAKELNVPIFYRKTKEPTLKPHVEVNPPKHYTYTREKNMF